MKILILIPSYNDNNHLPELIQRIQAHSNLSILVIDDGSIEPVILSDDTIIMIRNESNLGKGATLTKGFEYASQHGFSHVISIDSDLQHPPERVNDFSEYDERFDLVCGQRIIDSSMPLHRRISNKLTSKIISILCGQTVYDSQCGYRRYSVEAVLDTKCAENGFQFESEILIRLSRKGARIGHVPIPTIYGDESSSIHNIQDTFKFIRLILGSIWQKH
ncbi:MAG: glycosyltransferase family 2 protein [Candidatus Marinimicrobia bacterium]|nr:glycosyltransferase family 2 protein [Candidatus Neomarinimicrobiota bacterium]